MTFSSFGFQPWPTVLRVDRQLCTTRSFWGVVSWNALSFGLVIFEGSYGSTSFLVFSRPPGDLWMALDCAALCAAHHFGFRSDDFVDILSSLPFLWFL
jgi:hypothetical protein